MTFTSHRVIAEVPTMATKPCWSPPLMPQGTSDLICPSILTAFSLSLRHRHTSRTLFCRSLCSLLRALGALRPYPRGSLPHFFQALTQCHLLTKTILNPLFKTSSSMPSQALNTTPGSRPHRATGFPPVQVPFQVWPSWVSLPSLTTTLTPGKAVFTAAPSSPQIINDTGGRLRFSQLWNGKLAPGHTIAQRRKQLSIQPKGSPLAWSSRLAEGAGVTDTGRRKCQPSRGAAEIPVGGDVAQG